MKEKLTGTAEKIKAFFEKMSGKTRTLLIVGLSAIVVIAVVAAVILNNQPYTTLFTGLSGEDAASIMTFLEENGVTDYKMQNNDTVLVRKDQEASLKARVIMAGYPQSGFAYQHSVYFDNVGMLATEQDRNKASLLDLERQLSSVIQCMDGVKNASVQVAEGEDRRYVLDSSNVVKASATVVVEMKPGQSLEPLVKGIRSLVSNAVSGLEFENIGITDTKGNTYSAGEGTSASDASALKLQLEEQWNNKVRTEIMSVLGPLYGDENLRIAVNTVVDVSRRVGETTQYTSPEGVDEGEGIIGRKIYDHEIVNGTYEEVGGVVGTTSNADLPNYVENQGRPGEEDSYTHVSGDNLYNVNKSTEQVERLAATVADLTVAITINSTVAGQVNVPSITGHVARAAGITTVQQDEKISILAQPFYNPAAPIVPEPAPGLLDQLGIPDWAVLAAAGGLLLFLVLLIVILSLRRKRKRQQAKELVEEAGLLFAPAQEAEARGADIMNIKNERSMELRKEIRQFAEANPEIAAQLVKSWLKGGEENG